MNHYYNFISIFIITIFLGAGLVFTSNAQVKINVDNERGFYDNPVTVVISSDVPDALFSYTTDGSLPPISNGQTGPLTVQIDKSTPLRIVAWKTGLDTSRKNHTYIIFSNPVDYEGNTQNAYNSTVINSLKSLPALFISMPANDFETVRSSGSGGIGQSGGNEQYEKACGVELYYPDHPRLAEFQGKGFEEEAGLRPHSWVTEKRAFRLYFKKKYGAGKLNYPALESNPWEPGQSTATKEFDKLVLRHHSNDGWEGRWGRSKEALYLRDQFARAIQYEMGGLGTRSIWTHLFINGEYYGLYSPCERPDDNWQASYLGGDDDDYLGFNHGGVINEGADETIYNAFLNPPDLSNNNNYQNYKQNLDVKQFSDFLIAAWYCLTHGHDWPVNGDRPQNYYGGNRNNPPGPTQMFIWDFEASLNWDSEVHEKFKRNSSDKDQVWIKAWFALIENEEFMMTFADRAYKHLYNDGVLTEPVSNDRLTAMSEWVKPAIEAEHWRWDPNGNIGDWQNQLNKAYTKLPTNPANLIKSLREENYYPDIDPPLYHNNGTELKVTKLQTTSGYELTMSNPNGGGTIYYTTDGTDPRQVGGAVAGNAKTYNSETLTLNESTLVLARVKNGNEWSAVHCLNIYMNNDLTPLKVTEIMYHPTVWQDVDHTALEFIELKNTSTTETLDLSGVSFVDGIEYKFPLGATLAPQTFIVLASNKEMLLKKCPGTEISGEYTGQLRNSGEWIKAATFGGDTIIKFAYSDDAPWPVEADGLGYSLVPTAPNPVGDQNSASEWTSSTDNSCGSPNADDPASDPNALITNFTSSTTGICQGQTVTFTDQTLGIQGSASYSWDFGDGANPATASTKGPHTVTYSTQGSKTVKLTVSADNGSNEISKTDLIDVAAQVDAQINGNTSLCGVPSQTFVDFGDEWKYKKGTEEASSPTDAWRNLAFDDAGWSTGASPFRYGDGSGGTVLSDMEDSYSTVFLRKQFSVTNASAINELSFEVDYDDGFMVWINGTEVLNQGGVNNPAYDDLASTQHESGTQETFTISNASQFLVDGENIIAVMMFNATLSSSDIMFNARMSFNGDDLSSTLTASGGASYKWSTGDNTESITVNPSTTTKYYVTVSNGGCSVVDSAIVAVGEAAPIIVQSGNELQVTNVNGATSYQWYLNGNSINGATNSTYTATQPGEYTVEVQLSNGCSGTSSVYNFITTVTDRPELFSHFKMYPNPTQGTLNLELESYNNGKLNIEIFNYLGERVYYSREQVNGQLRKTIQLNDFASGIYQVRLSINGQAFVSKIVKE